MLCAGMKMFTRAVAGSCALLAGFAASGMATPAQAGTAQPAALASVLLISGKPVKAVVSRLGQKVNYTFAGKANKHVTFQVSKFNFSNGGSGGEVVLDFYEPGSSSVYTSCAFLGDDFCDFTPPVTGTWSAELVPVSDSVGNLTLTMT